MDWLPVSELLSDQNGHMKSNSMAIALRPYGTAVSLRPIRGGRMCSAKGFLTWRARYRICSIANHRLRYMTTIERIEKRSHYLTGNRLAGLIAEIMRQKLRHAHQARNLSARIDE